MEVYMSRKAIKHKHVEDLISTVRMEGLEPSQFIIDGLHKVADGKTTTRTLLNQLNAKYRTIAR